MFLLLSWLAFAAPIDLTQTQAWENAAIAMLYGPPGCYEVLGQASWDIPLGPKNASKGTAIWVGRMQDGVWRSSTVVPMGEMYRARYRDPKRVYTKKPYFIPIFGKLDYQNPASVPGSMRAALDLIRRPALRVWAEWGMVLKQEGVLLHRTFGDPNNPIETTVFFPDGGLVPESLTVHYPKRLRVVASGSKTTLYQATLRLRTQPFANGWFATAEAWSTSIGGRVYQSHGAQTIDYKSVVPCPSKAPTQPTTTPQPNASAESEPTPAPEPDASPGSKPEAAPQPVAAPQPKTAPESASP